MFRDGQLADVVQQRAARSASISTSVAPYLSDLDRVNAYAPQVLVRGMIFRLDGECQRFNGPQVQGGHFLTCFLLVRMPGFIRKLAQVKPVRAENQIHHGKNQNCQFPAKFGVGIGE